MWLSRCQTVPWAAFRASFRASIRAVIFTSEDVATALTEVLSNAEAQINKPFAILPCDQSEQRPETALACAR